MERCKTCKWWSAEPNEDDYAAEASKIHSCDHPKTQTYSLDPEKYRPASDDFVWIYGSQTLWTAPEFGCVHHEPNSLKTGSSIQANN